MIAFEYPSRTQLFSTVKDRKSLKELLEKQAQYIRSSKQWFRIASQKDRYIYCKCRVCHAKIKYALKGELFELTYMNNSHNHSSRISLNDQVLSYIQSMPTTMTTNSLMQMTTQRFNISKGQFYYINKKLWTSKEKFISIIEDLEFEDFQIRYEPFPLSQNDLPDLFMASSPRMIQNFKKFGENQFTTFDITYNLIKQVRIFQDNEGQTKHKKWGLGIFIGKNNFNKAIPFCFCIINSQTSEQFYKLFKSFFQIMKGQPAVFITDEQHAIASAIRDLKQTGDYRGEHLWDSFHIIRNLNNKSKNKELCNKLKEAMFVKTLVEFQQKIKITQQHAGDEYEDIRLYKRFIENRKRYCISQTPICFQGMSISTSFGQKVNDFIKTYITYQKPYKTIVKKLVRIFQLLQTKSESFQICKFKFQDLFPWKQLKVLRLSVCEAVFMAILKNYIESLPLRVIQQQRMFIVEQHQLEIRSKLYYCACGYQDRTGIPCRHLLKLISGYNEDVMNYIHSRWKVEIQQRKDSLFVKRGRSRLSKRNR